MTRRRDFLKWSVAGVAGGPAIIPSRAFGANEKIVLGVVGLGSQGFHNLNAFLKQKEDCQVVAVCDVDRFHYREHTSRKGRALGREPGKAAVDATNGDEGCAVYSDFRELCVRGDLDAVLVATPDHWHALVALQAIRSGKDVYCEKPVTHTFAEGEALLAAVEKHDAIFQTGSQQRSGREFRQAVNLVRNGVIGKVTSVEVGLPGGYREAKGSTEVESPPENLDYDFWCGSSPVLPYMRARHHRWWRGHTAYGGGTLMDWIGHHNDIAHWGLGADTGGPKTVEAVGWTKPGTPVYDGPADYEIRCQYPGEVSLVISSKIEGGTRWTGTDGWVWVNRGRIQASNPEWLKPAFGPGEFRAYESPGHHQNFLECIRSRRPCVAPAETAHRSITPGHLGFVSNRLGRPLQFDPENRRIIGDREAQGLLTKVDYRGDWKL